MSDCIDLGRFERERVGPSLYTRARRHFGVDDDPAWEERYRRGKHCPGPGHGEPVCGRLIINHATRCRSCAALWNVYEKAPDLDPAICERPRTEVDTAEYLRRLRAEVAARKVVQAAKSRA